MNLPTDEWLENPTVAKKISFDSRWWLTTVFFIPMQYSFLLIIISTLYIKGPG